METYPDGVTVLRTNLAQLCNSLRAYARVVRSEGVDWYLVSLAPKPKCAWYFDGTRWAMFNQKCQQQSPALASNPAPSQHEWARSHGTVFMADDGFGERG